MVTESSVNPVTRLGIVGCKVTIGDESDSSSNSDVVTA